MRLSTRHEQTLVCSSLENGIKSPPDVTASGGGLVGTGGGAPADRQPVGAHALPFLNEQAAILEQRADAARVPPGDLLEHRDEHAQGVVADHRTSRDLSDEARFGRGDRETITAIDVEHDVNVRAAGA